MGASVKDIAAGRKTFFITPDISLFPENFCEEYLSEGYECYFVSNDKKIPLAAKIDIIVSVFKDVMIFFNIDANIPGINWPVFIKNINDKYGGEVPIGVLFTKRQKKQEKQLIERKYLYDIGLVCGCIQLEYQKKINFGIIEKVLFANQAMGRRKSVRAICNNNCTFQFEHGKQLLSGNLSDISLSHFTCTFPDGQITIPQYEKVNDIQFNVKGLHFRSNAIMFLQRQTQEGENLMVFTFVSKQDGSNGLDLMTRQLLAPKIYQLMLDNYESLMTQLYKSYLKKEAEIVETGTALDFTDLEELEDLEEDE